MKFHFAGKYDGNPESLPNQKFIEGSTKFREPGIKLLALLGNALSIAILVVTIGLFSWRSDHASFSLPGFLLAFAVLIPHELLHAVCFREDVYMYTVLSKGMLFVVGSESMTKAHFIFMSMLPNIVFGFIPFAVFLINPTMTLLGTLGAFAIAFGAGDYINVYNALTQVPNNGLTYLYQQNSYWYIPE